MKLKTKSINTSCQSKPLCGTQLIGVREFRQSGPFSFHCRTGTMVSGSWVLEYGANSGGLQVLKLVLTRVAPFPT